MYWLNQNAGAVQAIMAIIIGALTIALVGVTWWYARLTRRMADAMERQLSASFQPDINLSLFDLFHGTGSHNSEKEEHVSLTIAVTNKGNVPIKIVAVSTKIVFSDKSLAAEKITIDAEHRVLAPGRVTEFPHVTVQVSLGSTAGKFERRVLIHCSDLAGIGKHTFSTSDINQNITNHSLGFQPI